MYVKKEGFWMKHTIAPRWTVLIFPKLKSLYGTAFTTEMYTK